MNFLDSGIIDFLNQFARRSWRFDFFMHFLTFSHLLKGGIFVTVLWWMWFKNGETIINRRERIIAAIIACIVALFVARAMALSLPFRPRPLQSPDVLSVVPHTIDKSLLGTWSAFPSDHAVLFFAFAAGLWFISRSMGVFAFLYASFAICLPKIYLGLHYPTDIIAGAFIGIGIAWLAQVPRISGYFVKPAMKWQNNHPASFYAIFFLLTYQIADMFDSTRALGNVILAILK